MVKEQKLNLEGDQEAHSNCTDSDRQKRLGKVGGPISGRGNSISKDAELRGLLCVQGTLPSA